MKHKKLLAILTLVCFMFTLVPVAAFAETEVTVATAEELSAAIANATGMTSIKLTGDVELTNGLQIKSTQALTIDLNGNTISYNPATSGTTYVIDNAGNLTIKDSSEAGTGKITSSAKNPDTATIPGYASNTIRNGGTFTLESGIIENTTASGSACYAIDTAWYSNSSAAGPIVNIKGGKVVAVKPAIRMIGYATEKASTLNISGGEIEGYRAFWIHLPSETNADAPLVNVNISGGTLSKTESGDKAIYSYSFGNAYSGVNINISDGTFNGDIALGGGSGNGGSGAETVNITGGTFTGVYTYNGNAEDIEISGGTFVVEPYAAYIAEGKVTAQNSDETWTVGDVLNKTFTAQEVVYDGTAKAYDIEEGFTVTYLLNGETVTNPTNVGDYTVIINRDAQDGYVAFTQTIENGLVITHATLTATYVSETIKVGETPALAVTVEGFVNGETAATAAGYEAPTIANENTAAGTYTLTPTGGAAANYAFEYVAGTLTIEPADIDEETPVPEVTVKPGVVVGESQTGVAGNFVADENATEAVDEILSALGEAEEPGVAHEDLEAAASEEVKKVIADEDVVADATRQLQAVVPVESGATVTLVAQPYMDIKLSNVSTTESAVQITKVTFDITPMYQLVATTATNMSDIRINGEENNANAVKVGDPQPLDIMEINMVIPLPASFIAQATNETAYVQHKAYEYTAEVGASGASFANIHGFSEFTVSLESEAVAQVEDVAYTSLSVALDEAENGAIIKVLKPAEATVSTTKAVKLMNETEEDITVKINGTNYVVTAGGVDFSYTAPVYSSGSGGGFTGVYNYPVNIVEVANGTLKADQFSAVKGETVIVTATPDNGFGTAKVIVTDGDDDTIAVTDLQNGTYSFVMPEGEVDVTAVFKGAVTLKIGDTKMNVFGKTVVNDVAPQIKGDYTMLPIRPVVEALDGDVAWDPDTQKITVKLNGNTVVMYVGEKVGYINGAATEMDVPSYIDNSRALYQLRFVAEATDTNIYWNKATYEVTLIPE